MRTVLLAILATATVLAAGSASAATPGPVCKTACAPRIAQDCGVPGVRGFGKCKRRLVRACKRTTPEVACALADEAAPGSGGRPGGAGGGLAARIAAALADKRIEASSEQLFGSGSVTETDDMTLCGSGGMHLVVTTITSTFDASFSNTFDSTDVFDGTWTVRVDAGAAVLELATGEPTPRRFAVEIDASGTVVIDGRTASVSDPAGACGAGVGGGTSGAGTGGGNEDAVAQITEALADRFLALEETNVGFGRRVTAIVLCASGRYALEIDASVLPGVEVSTQGDWTVRLDGTTPILDLVGEAGQPTRTFAVGADADGNLLLNDLPASAGDASVVAQVCPTL